MNKLPQSKCIGRPNMEQEFDCNRVPLSIFRRYQDLISFSKYQAWRMESRNEQNIGTQLQPQLETKYWQEPAQKATKPSVLLDPIFYADRVQLKPNQGPKQSTCRNKWIGKRINWHWTNAAGRLLWTGQPNRESCTWNWRKMWPRHNDPREQVEVHKRSWE